MFIAKTTKTRYCSHKCNSRGYKANVKGLKIEISSIETNKSITPPIEEIKAKEFLSIKETYTLIGLSRRSLYRLIKSERLQDR